MRRDPHDVIEQRLMTREQELLDHDHDDHGHDVVRLRALSSGQHIDEEE